MNPTFVFAGNRFFVLEEMLKANLDIIQVFAVEGSFLEKELTKRGISFQTIANGKDFIIQLDQLNFTHFIANGLPYILPITHLTKGNQKFFINIHPSYLPDLRGKDPVPGAVLFGKDSGATCHFMNDKIDDGDIIAQIKIDYSTDLDCALLYQLTFQAEKQVFNLALNNNFIGQSKQKVTSDLISYKVKTTDKDINFSQNADSIVRTIKAFNTRSQGACFVAQGKTFVVKNAKFINHNFSILSLSCYEDNEIVFVFENKILLRKDKGFLYLEEVSGDLSLLKPGCAL